MGETPKLVRRWSAAGKDTSIKMYVGSKQKVFDVYEDGKKKVKNGSYKVKSWYGDS